MSMVRRIVILAALVLLTFGSSFGQAQSTGEVILPEGTRISLQLNDYLSTKLSREGDTFTADVIVPVFLADRLVIPKGSVVTGSVSRILRPGRFRGKAVMNLLFLTVRIPGREALPLVASLARVDPEGNSGVQAEGSVKGEGSIGSDTARVLKPSATGAGIGALAGGGRGAAVGGGIGAVVGIATVFATRGKDLEVRRGSTMDISLDRPLAVPVDGRPATVKIR